jgi:hypothetical protein
VNAIIAAALSKRARAFLESSVIYEWDERNYIGGGAVCLGKCALRWSNGVEIELGQLAENFIVTLVSEKGDARVLVAPDAIHNGNGYEHAGSDHRVDVAEFTGVDTSADDSSQELLSTSDDLLRVKPGEVGELVQLSEYEAVNGDEHR